MSTVADRIKETRISLNLTQAELAKRMGLSGKAAICKIELAGDKVSLKTINRVADATGASVPYLMGWTEEGKKKAIPEASLVLNEVLKDKELTDALKVYFKMTPQEKKHIIDTVYLVGRKKP